ncbi:MAG TPA: DMT family transporter [Gemmatimonadaceae bacterium]
MASTAPEAIAPTRTARGRQLGLTDGLLFLMALIWAVNYSVLKFGTRLVHPLAYNGFRIPLAAILQFGVARAMRLPPIPRSDAVRLIILGMLGNGVYQIFFILGQARSRVATTVLVLASGPALAAIIGRLHGSERLGARSWTGVAFQLVGVSCVVLGTAGSTAGRDSLLGAALVLASALSWAWFSVLVKPFTERISGLHVGAYTMLGGGIVSLAVAVPSMLDTSWVHVSPAVWLALAYSTIGAMIIAYLFWYHGVKTLGPTHTSMYSNLQPLLAMGIAWPALGERPTPWQLAGTVLVMSGLLVARTASHKAEAA